MIGTPEVALGEVDDADHALVRLEARSLKVATDSGRFVRITHLCILQDDARYENRYPPVLRAIMDHGGPREVK